jgi:hypothetical protein
MEKFAAPIIAIVSVFLYFTHDAGFNFEEAKPEKRVEFVERQSAKAAAHAGFAIRSSPDAVFISADQRLARLKLRSDDASNFGTHQLQIFTRACKGYSDSYLGKHDISLRFEFYRDTGAMTGTMSLSPGVCARQAAKVS